MENGQWKIADTPYAGGLARAAIASGVLYKAWLGDNVARNLVRKSSVFLADSLPRLTFSGIAVYLMSKASSYHTADLFIIDGGYSAF